MTSRKAHWEGVYKSVDPTQVNWYQSDPALSLELIGAVSTPESTILDVGGGGALLIDRLIREGYKNISVMYLRLRSTTPGRDWARRHRRSNGLRVTPRGSGAIRGSMSGTIGQSSIFYVTGTIESPMWRRFLRR